MSHGGLSLAEASGMCFRRMVWGHGPHLFYTSMMQRLRRLVSRFAREFAKEYITYKQHHNNLTIIDPWSKKIVDKNIFHFHNRSSSSFSKKASREHQLSTHRTQLVSDQGNPLKILIYSRGNNIRKSRAIDNETAIVAALKARGAAVTICCDYSRTSLVQQLFNAVQADVVIFLFDVFVKLLLCADVYVIVVFYTFLDHGRTRCCSCTWRVYGSGYDHY